MTLNKTFFAFILFFFLIRFAGAQDGPMPLALWWPDSFATGPFDVPKDVQGFKLGRMSPNEIKQLSLRNWPKTAGLRLGITKRSDVVRVFGSDCTVPCRLDDKVTLGLNYYDRRNGRGSNSFVVSDGLRKKTRLRDKFYDTLQWISLSPWTYIAVARNDFPAGLQRICRVIPGRLFTFEEGPVKGLSHIKFLARETRNRVEYVDGYGLSYTTTLRGNESCSSDPLPTREFIDYVSYHVPYAFERSMYEVVPGEIIP